MSRSGTLASRRPQCSTAACHWLELKMSTPSAYGGEVPTSFVTRLVIYSHQVVPWAPMGGFGPRGMGRDWHDHVPWRRDPEFIAGAKLDRTVLQRVWSF